MNNKDGFQFSNEGCPNCQHKSAWNSRTRIKDLLIRLFLPLKPLRCKKCMNRYWVYTNNYSKWGVNLLLSMGVVVLLMQF